MGELARNFVVEGNILKIKAERMFHFLVFFKVPNTKLALGRMKFDFSPRSQKPGGENGGGGGGIKY